MFNKLGQDFESKQIDIYTNTMEIMYFDVVFMHWIQNIQFCFEFERLSA